MGHVRKEEDIIVVGGRGGRGPKDFVVPFSDTTNFAITPDATAAAAAATAPLLVRDKTLGGPFVLGNDIDRSPPTPHIYVYVYNNTCDALGPR